MCRGENSHRFYRWGLNALPIYLLVALLLSSCAGSIIGHGSGTNANNTPAGFVKLNTGLVPIIYNATNIGAVPDNQLLRVELTFKINPEGSRALMATDKAQANSAPNIAELADTVGLSSQLYQRIKAYFTGPDVKVTSEALRTDMIIDAPASAFNTFFHTTLTLYKTGDPQADTPSTQRYYAPERTQPPALPAFIANALLAVTGLDSHTALPMHHASLSPLSTAHATAVQQAQAANCVNYRTDLLLPAQVGKAYQYNQLWDQGYRGQGMNVSIVSFDMYDGTDLANYFSCVGYKGHLSANVHSTATTAPSVSATAVAPGNTNIGNSSGTTSNGFSAGQGSSTSTGGIGAVQQGDETTPDVEAIAGLAPQSNIALYLYNHQSKSVFDDYATIYTDMLQQIIDDNLGHNHHAGDVVNLSWGNAETVLNTSFMQAFNQRLWLLTNVLHMTVFAASGDCGAFDSSVYNKLAVDFPASSPSSVAVGGTQLTLDQQGERATEQVWSDNVNTDACRNRWGSGGGMSTIFPQEAWQYAPGMSNQNAQHMRQLPDVSSVAYNIPIYYGGYWMMATGTSMATPIWAAGMLLLNQGLIARKGQYYYGPQFFYQLANRGGGSALFNDITSGTNLHYPATPGWDMASGAGSPNLGTIFRSLT